MPTFLKADDFTVILAEPVAERRARLARRLYADHAAGALTEEESEAALRVFRAIAADDDARVRAAFARFVAASPALSGEVAERLALDIPQVSNPVVIQSPVLSDEFLVDLVGGGPASRQLAVARRTAVSAPVSAAVIEVAPAGVCTTLLRNPGARLPGFAFERLAERFGDDHVLREALLAHPQAPIELIEDQLTGMAHRLGHFVAESGWLDPESAHDNAQVAVEQAFALYAHGRRPEVADRLVRRWVRAGRVHAPFIMRAASLGADHVLESAFSEGARLPVERVRAILSDRGIYGLTGLCLRMGLPGDLPDALMRLREARARLPAQRLPDTGSNRPAKQGAGPRMEWDTGPVYGTRTAAARLRRTQSEAPRRNTAGLRPAA